MKFELLLFSILFCIFFFLVILPVIKFIRQLTPKNPLKEAKIRLETAKLEAEAANLNKETEKIYSSLYDDVIEKKGKL